MESPTFYALLCITGNIENLQIRIFFFYRIPLLDGSVDRRLENLWREKVLFLSCFLEAPLETAAAAQPQFLLKQCVLSSGAQLTRVTGG